MSTTLRKGSTCPTCKKAKLVPLIFGLPGMELVEQEARGEIVLAGCVSGEFPQSSNVSAVARSFIGRANW